MMESIVFLISLSASVKPVVILWHLRSSGSLINQTSKYQEVHAHNIQSTKHSTNRLPSLLTFINNIVTRAAHIHETRLCWSLWRISKANTAFDHSIVFPSLQAQPRLAHLTFHPRVLALLTVHVRWRRVMNSHHRRFFVCQIIFEHPCPWFRQIDIRMFCQ